MIVLFLPAAWPALRVRQHHVDVEYLQVALAIQRDLDVVGIDLGVLGNDGDQFLVQGGQEVRATAAAAFAGDDDLQAFLGGGGRLRLGGNRKESKAISLRPKNALE